MNEPVTAPTPGGRGVGAGSRPRRRRRKGSSLLARGLLAVLVLLIGVVLVATGATLVIAYVTQRDASGYFTIPTEVLSTPSYALSSSPSFGTNPGPADWLPIHNAGTLRLKVRLSGDQPVFVGIATKTAVDHYLGLVEHDEVEVTSTSPFEASYRHVAGGKPGLPGDQDIWAASASGPGLQQLAWKTRPGTFAAVVMRADGGAGVTAAVSIGAQPGWVLPVGGGLLGGGVVVLLGAAMLAARAALRRPTERPGDKTPGDTSPAQAATGNTATAQAATGDAVTTATPEARPGPAPAPGPVLGPAPAPGPVPEEAAAGADRTYPVRLEARLDEPLGRFRWLVKWLLALPHLLVLSGLWVAFFVVTFVAGVSILVTGRYPPGLFGFNVGVLRWTWRVAYYSYGALGTDRYPPFSLEPDPSYPADLEIDYPEHLSRGLVLVKWWLLALPQYVVVGALVGGFALAPWSRSDWALFAFGGGLIGLLVLVAGILLAFEGRYERHLYDVVVGLDRWVCRVVAYAALMRDEYPPFHLATGGDDPGGTLGPARR